MHILYLVTSFLRRTNGISLSAWSLFLLPANVIGTDFEDVTEISFDCDSSDQAQSDVSFRLNNYHHSVDRSVDSSIDDFPFKNPLISQILILI